MLKNYFKVAFRNLFKQKDSSLINVLGLTIGIAGCLLIGLFVHDELKFDKQHPDHNRLYRIYAESFRSGGELTMAATSPMIGPTLKEEFPEVSETLRLYQDRQKLLFKRGEETYLEDKGFFAEPTIFDLFHLPFVHGDPATALTEPNTIVLTETLATKYFGSENPVGQNLDINNNSITVAGVIEDLSPHFHFTITITVSAC